MDIAPDSSPAVTLSPAEDLLAALADRGFYLLGLSPDEHPDSAGHEPEVIGKVEAVPPGAPIGPEAQAFPRPERSSTAPAPRFIQVPNRTDLPRESGPDQTGAECSLR
ncbi:hypothetical protein D3C80_1205440 [compost metagenome]|jgi:hypothetical protein